MAKNNAKNAERGEMTLSPTIKYVESTGLFVEKGVILGKYKNKYISDASSRNIMIFYPMGYGKGVSTVIPTLLSWEESAVVHDITAENFT
ncbi:MAG: type IV secretory system conjugative DNA transfer family protein, partial [Rickettsiales bacterium]|nr:type IV secretory system conjugative DNA transfer family protein [Rickettsiales bacterium]